MKYIYEADFLTEYYLMVHRDQANNWLHIHLVYEWVRWIANRIFSWCSRNLCYVPNTWSVKIKNNKHQYCDILNEFECKILIVVPTNNDTNIFPLMSLKEELPSHFCAVSSWLLLAKGYQKLHPVKKVLCEIA